jgi:hypothetical protein
MAAKLYGKNRKKEEEEALQGKWWLCQVAQKH